MAKNFVTIDQLLNRIGKMNLAADLSDELTGKISLRCLADYEADEQSRKPWMEKSREALDLAMQTAEAKTFPWPDAANVKYPLLTTAALQFHARAYPSIIRGNQVVKCQITGDDPAGEKALKAERISKFMSWQCLEDMDGWEEDVDKLLICLPILGCMFKKTYFDTNTKKNRSDLVYPQDLVINYKVKSMAALTRLTQLFTLSPQSIIERQMQGVYLDDDIAFGSDQDSETEQEMIEQHCLIDLDEDGYKEPYIATLHKVSGKLLRLVANYDKDTIFVKFDDDIVSLEDLELRGVNDLTQFKLARIAPVSYFTKFPFIPSPDGGIYDIGFGQILIPIIETINTSVNQLLDSGTLQNTGGGLIAKGLLTDKKGTTTFSPGEYKQVDNLTGGPIRDAIYRFEHSGPSAVTFNLLDRLIAVCKDMTTVQDIMVGESAGDEKATTTLARVDQGMKLFTAIYKRVYRSLKEEFKKLKRLNKLYLPVSQYYRVLDSGLIAQIGLADFQGDDTDVQPVADPTISSLPLKLAKVQALKQASTGNPLYNQREVEKRFLEALEEPNVEALLVPENQMQPPPDPKMLEVQGKLGKIAAEIEKMKIDNVKTASETVLNLAKAEAEEVGQQMESYRLQMDALAEGMNQMREDRKLEMPTEQGGVGTMEARPAEQSGAESGEGLSAGLEGIVGEGNLLEGEQSGTNGSGNGADSGDV